MAKRTYINFKGIRPQIAAQLLPINAAQTAANCKLQSGELRPWKNEQYLETLNDRTTILTINRYLSQYWLEWPAIVDVVEGPIAGDTTGRRYYTGDGIPKKTNQTEALTGSGAYPINFYPMGVPVPAFAITAALGAGGSGTARDVAYLWTIVTSWGEESAPSAQSNIVSALQGQTVNLSGMTLVWQSGQAYTTDDWVVPSVLGNYVYKCVQAGTSGTSEPTWGTTVDEDTEDNTCQWRCYKKGILFDSGAVKRIYRTNTGDSTASWQLLDTIAMTDTTYADTTTDANLEATILPSSYTNGEIDIVWNPPPETLSGIVALSGGYFAGFIGKDVYFSEPYYPHAWPTAYKKTMDATVIGLAADGNTTIVLTNDKPVLLQGTHPDNLTPNKLPLPRACVSKRGIVNFPGGALYPSIIGLEAIIGTEQRTLTDGYYTKDEWALVYPSTLNAAFYNGCYFGFYSSGGNTGGIVIDFKTGDVTTLGFYSSAIFVDRATETLYFLKQQAEVRLREDGTPYPSRTGARLTEAGDYRLLES